MMAGEDPRQLRDQASKAMLDGDFKKAAKAFEQLLELTPNDLKSKARYAENLQRLGKTTEAIGVYEQVAKRYAAEGFLVQAIAVAKIVLRIDPNQKEIEARLTEWSQERSGGAPIGGTSETTSDDGGGLLPATTPLFQDLNADEIKDLSGTFELKSYKAAEALCHEGDPGDSLFVIASGSARAVTVDALGRPTPLGHLKAGDFFGEYAFLSQVPRNASVIAEEDTQAVTIGRDKLMALLERHPRMKAMLEEYYKLRVLARILSINPIFRYVPYEVREKLAVRFSSAHYEAGQTIIREGDKKADTFYIIRVGRVVVTMHPPGSSAAVKLSDLEGGDFFGEVALITNRPRTATVTALTPVEAMVLTKDAFDSIALEYPVVRQVVENFQKRRVKETIEVLTGKSKSEAGQAGLL